MWVPGSCLLSICGFSPMVLPSEAEELPSVSLGPGKFRAPTNSKPTNAQLRSDLRSQEWYREADAYKTRHGRPGDQSLGVTKHFEPSPLLPWATGRLGGFGCKYSGKVSLVRKKGFPAFFFLRKKDTSRKIPGHGTQNMFDLLKGVQEPICE